jgi:hypothetical protein
MGGQTSSAKHYRLNPATRSISQSKFVIKPVDASKYSK